MIKNVLLLRLLLISFSSESFQADRRTEGLRPESLRVAVVGGGIGGTSFAYFLSKTFPGAQITVYEAGEVGGRLATAALGGRQYETGGSIIHEENKYMVQILKECGLRRKQTPVTDLFSIVKDDNFIFQEWGYSIADKIRLAYQYGPLQLLKLHNFYQSILRQFISIYPALEEGRGFPSVEHLLAAMGGTELSRITLEQALLREQVQKKLIDEVVGVAVKFNYGQLPRDIHAFVGAVALVGFDKELWAVEGGNKKVAECALRVSGGELVTGTVSRIAGKLNQMFEVSLESGEKRNFDIVVLAAPYTEDRSSIRISFEENGKEINIDKSPGSYLSLWSTLVRGDLNWTAAGFGLNSFTTANTFYLSSSNVWSIESLSPVDQEPTAEPATIYRIFSHQPLHGEDLENLFTDIQQVVERNWMAYPIFTENNDFSEFQLAPGLFYLNRIEQAASAMEMSVISARNIANLLAEQFTSQPAEFLIVEEGKLALPLLDWTKCLYYCICGAAAVYFTLKYSGGMT